MQCRVCLPHTSLLLEDVRKQRSAIQILAGSPSPSQSQLIPSDNVFLARTGRNAKQTVSSLDLQSPKQERKRESQDGAEKQERARVAEEVPHKLLDELKGLKSAVEMLKHEREEARDQQHKHNSENNRRMDDLTQQLSLLCTQTNIPSKLKNTKEYSASLLQSRFSQNTPPSDPLCAIPHTPNKVAREEEIAELQRKDRTLEKSLNLLDVQTRKYVEDKMQELALQQQKQAKVCEDIVAGLQAKVVAQESLLKSTIEEQVNQAQKFAAEFQGNLKLHQKSMDERWQSVTNEVKHLQTQMKDMVTTVDELKSAQDRVLTQLKDSVEKRLCSFENSQDEARLQMTRLIASKIAEMERAQQHTIQRLSEVTISTSNQDPTAKGQLNVEQIETQLALVSSLDTKVATIEDMLSQPPYTSLVDNAVILHDHTKRLCVVERALQSLPDVLNAEPTFLPCSGRQSVPAAAALESGLDSIQHSIRGHDLQLHAVEAQLGSLNAALTTLGKEVRSRLDYIENRFSSYRASIGNELISYSQQLRTLQQFIHSTLVSSPSAEELIYTQPTMYDYEPLTPELHQPHFSGNQQRQSAQPDIQGQEDSKHSVTKVPRSRTIPEPARHESDTLQEDTRREDSKQEQKVLSPKQQDAGIQAEGSGHVQQKQDRRDISTQYDFGIDPALPALDQTKTNPNTTTKRPIHISPSQPLISNEPESGARLSIPYTRQPERAAELRPRTATLPQDKEATHLQQKPNSMNLVVAHVDPQSKQEDPRPVRKQEEPKRSATAVLSQNQAAAEAKPPATIAKTAQKQAATVAKPSQNIAVSPKPTMPATAINRCFTMQERS